MLYLNLIINIAVIWPTLLLLADSSDVSLINNEMTVKLRACRFPLNNFETKWCNYPKPDRGDTIIIMFNFPQYLCMELLDVSIQLCDPKWKDKVPSSNELKKKFPIPGPEDICNQLKISKFPNIETYFSKEAIDLLQNQEKCRRVCISDGVVNRVCEEIFLSYKLLAELHSEKPTQTQTIVNATEPSSALMSVHEQNTDHEDLTRSNVDGIPNLTSDLLPRKSDQGYLAPVSNPENRAPIGKETEADNTNKELISESDSNRGLQKTQLSQDHHESNTGSETVQHLQLENPNVEENINRDSPSPVSPSSPHSSTINSTKIDTTGKVIASASVEQHEEMNSANLKNTGIGEGIVNDDQSPLADDDNGDLESKVSILEDLSSSDPHDDSYDGVPDDPQNSANSIEQPNETIVLNRGVDSQDSHFFAYFLTMVVICIVGYLLFHNKQKIIALALEGRRMQGSRRRPNTSSYKKLDSNLEEAVTSSCSSSSVTHVIF